MGQAVSKVNPERAAMVEDPTYYRWSSYRTNGLGQPDSLITPHPVYMALAREETGRIAAYRTLFRPQLDAESVSDIRMALHQSQPLGNSRFLASIKRMTGQKREAKPRGRPRKATQKEVEC